MPIRKIHWQEFPSALISHCGQHYDKCLWSPSITEVTCTKCLRSFEREKSRRSERSQTPQPEHVQGKTNKPKKDKIRINMDVELKTKERLDNLVVKLEASGYTEVIRRALIYFEKGLTKYYDKPKGS